MGVRQENGMREREREWARIPLLYINIYMSCSNLFSVCYSCLVGPGDSQLNSGTGGLAQLKLAPTVLPAGAYHWGRPCRRSAGQEPGVWWHAPVVETVWTLGLRSSGTGGQLSFSVHLVLLEFLSKKIGYNQVNGIIRVFQLFSTFSRFL